MGGKLLIHEVCYYRIFSWNLDGFDWSIGVQ